MRSIRFFSLIIILGLMVSCNKDQAISMHWDETGCFNPWDNFITLDTFTTEAYHQDQRLFNFRRNNHALYFI